MTFGAFLNQWWNFPYLVMLGLVAVFFILHAAGMLAHGGDADADAAAAGGDGGDAGGEPGLDGDAAPDHDLGMEHDGSLDHDVSPDHDVSHETSVMMPAMKVLMRFVDMNAVTGALSRAVQTVDPARVGAAPPPLAKPSAPGRIPERPNDSH